MSRREPEPPGLSRAVLGYAARWLGTPDLPADARELYHAKASREGLAAARAWYRRQARAAAWRALADGTAGTSALVALRVRREVSLAARRLRGSPARSVSFALVVGAGIAGAAFMSQIRSAMLRPDLGLGREVHLVSWVDSAGRTLRSLRLSGREAWLREPHPSAGTPVPFWPVSRPLDTPHGLLRASGQAVRPGYFGSVSVTPVLGRDLERPGEVVLSARLWSTRWNTDPAAVGSTLLIAGAPATIVGVAPPDFDGTMCCVPPDFWVVRPDDAATSTAVLGFAGATDPATVASWLGTVAAEGADGSRAVLTPTTSASYGGDRGFVARTLSVLGGLATAAWLATLLGGANLVLSDTARRAPELRMRRALGAGRLDVFVGMLAETAWMAALAGVVALIVTGGLVEVAPWLLPMVGGVSAVDLRLGSAAGVSVALTAGAAAIACALPGALAAQRLASDTRGAQGAYGRQRAGFETVGLATQVALASALLMVTGLFVQSIRALDGDFVGFRHGDTAVHFVSASDAEAAPTAPATLEAVTAARPDALVALTRRLPVYGARWDTLAFASGLRVAVAAETVTPGFFDVVGTALLAGRPARSEREVVISEDLASRAGLAPDRAAGATVTLGEEGPRTVVGVVEAATWGGGRVRPTAYVGWGDRPVTSAVLLARGRGGSPPELGVLLGALRSRAMALQPFETLDGLLVRSRVLTVFLTRLALAFGALCTLVAVGGIHAHFLRWVSARSRSLAIRSALGAPRPALRRGVVAAAVRVVAPAGLAGGTLGWMMAGMAGSVLGDVSAPGAGVVLGAAAVLALATATALAVPVIRAGLAEPLALFRSG